MARYIMVAAVLQVSDGGTAETFGPGEMCFQIVLSSRVLFKTAPGK